MRMDSRLASAQRSHGGAAVRRARSSPSSSGEGACARALDAVGAAVGLDVDVDLFGGAPQRQLAQRQEVALLEEVLGGAARLLGQVDLPLVEPLEQHLGRPFEWAVLKGRSNYVCLQRLRELSQAGDGQLELEELANTTKLEVKRLAEWAGRTFGEALQSAVRSLAIGADGLQSPPLTPADMRAAKQRPVDAMRYD